MSTGALAFLAGVGGGYLKGRDQKRQQQREDTRDAREAEEYGFRKEERDRTRSERSALAEASKPLEVEEVATVNQAAGGMEEAPQRQYRVGGKSFGDSAAAQAAAAELNSPDQVAARQVAALQKLGRPQEANQLRASNAQVKASEFTLSREQEKMANEKWDQQLSGIRSATDAAGLLSGSPLVGGKRVIPVELDGGKKAQFAVVGEDGTQQMMGKPFDNNEKGLQGLMTSYSKSLSLAQKVGFMHQQAQMEQQQQNADRTFGEGQRQFDINKSLQERQIGVGAANAAASRAIAQGNLDLQREKWQQDLKNNPDYALPAAVRMQAQAIGKQIEQLNQAALKAEADGTANPDALEKMRARSTGLQMRMNDMLQPYAGKQAAAGPAGAGADPLALKGAAGAGTAGGGMPMAAMAGPQQRAPVAAAMQQQAQASQPQQAQQPPQTAAATDALGALEAARADRQAAEKALTASGKWGLKQQRDNPEGFRAAQRKVEQMVAKEREAEAAYDATISPDNRRPAFVPPR